jgi:hypothetical protein
VLTAFVLIGAVVAGWVSSRTGLALALVVTSAAALASAVRLVSFRNRSLLWFVVSLAAAGMVATRRLPLSLLQILLCLAIVFVGVWPFARWSRGSGPRLPFFPTLCFVFALLFATGPLLGSEFAALHLLVPMKYLTAALVASLASLVMMQIGYSGARRSTAHPAERRLYITSHSDTVWIAVALGGLAAYALLPSLVPLRLAQFTRFGAELPMLAMAELAVRWRAGRLSQVGKVFVAVALPARVFIGFATAANFQAYVVLLVIGVAIVAVNRRLPVVFLVVAIAGLGVFQPIKELARKQQAKETFSNAYAHVGDYTQVLGDVGADSNSLGDIRDAFAVRYGYTSTLAHVMSLTPTKVPYWFGATYRPLVFKPLPRLIYPDKPQEVTGQTFGHRYGLLGPSDLRTSYNMPQLVELYANFGWWGVVLGSLVFGVLYAFSERFVTRSLLPRIGTSGAAYLLCELLVIEGGFSLHFSQFVYSTILVGSLHVALRSERTAAIDVADMQMTDSSADSALVHSAA